MDRRSASIKAALLSIESGLRVNIQSQDSESGFRVRIQSQDSESGLIRNRKKNVKWPKGF
jgi:hypothetical protein